VSGSVVDEPLRIRAREIVGPLGDALAHEVLEHGTIAVEHDVLAWEGSHGTIRAHRVVLSCSSELSARISANHAAKDGLFAALAAAMSERAGHSVADVRIAITSPGAASAGPYRDPRGDPRA